MPKVGVVILNYKLKDQTLKSIESVLNSDYKNISIIVVDNNSMDGLGEALAGRGDMVFIQNNENLGYAGGNNIGIKKALEMGAAYVFILNPDALVEPRTIGNLVSKAEIYNAGISNPKIYFMGTKKIWFGGKIFDKANVLAMHRGVNQEDIGQYDDDEEMEDATGAAILIRSDVFAKIGFFDERFFLYYEESDFCFRAKLAGFKIMYIPSAVVFHKNAQSTGLGSSLQDYFITRNRMLFASKHLPLRTQFALFREALRHINHPARKMAFMDHLLGKYGKGSFIIQ